MDHCEAGHFNYIGDSILGRYVNMGAGSRLANLQFRSVDEKEKGFIRPIQIPLETEDLKTNMEKFKDTNYTEKEYEKLVDRFSKNPDPKGKAMKWVCRDRLDHLNLKADPLEFTPS